MAIINFFNAAVCAELLALITALLFITLRGVSWWQLFILYLLLVMGVELGGYYVGIILKKPNYVFYHFLMMVQVGFFSFLFYRFLPIAKVRQWIWLLSLTFVNFFMLEWLMAPEGAFFQYSRQYESFLVVIFSCIFYFSILKNDQVFNPLTHPPFWIITGLFFYYFGSAAMFAFSDAVSRIKFTGNLTFYNVVMGTLSCILYGCWIIAFICRKKQQLSYKQ